MDLVLLQSDQSSRDDSYKKLLHKYWFAVVFSLPIFFHSYGRIGIKNYNIGIGYNFCCLFQLCFMQLERFMYVRMYYSDGSSSGSGFGGGFGGGSFGGGGASGGW